MPLLQIRLLMSKQVRAPLPVAAKVKMAWQNHFSHIRKNEYEDTYKSDPMCLRLFLVIGLVHTQMQSFCLLHAWCEGIPDIPGCS